MPLEFDDGNTLAARAVDVGSLIQRAELTGQLVYLVVVTFAALTVPAARDPLHRLLPLARLTRQAADRRGVSVLSAGPLHVFHLWV